MRCIKSTSVNKCFSASEIQHRNEKNKKAHEMNAPFFKHRRKRDYDERN